MSTTYSQVVLPDTKRPDADTVIWLGDQHAADDPETAEQRGAVAALQQLAGERAFHRILPPEFRNLWEALGEEVCPASQACTLIQNPGKSALWGSASCAPEILFAFHTVISSMGIMWSTLYIELYTRHESMPWL